MVFSPPLILDQEVAFKNGLNHKVVFLIPLLKQSLLHDRQLGLVDAYEAAFGFSYGHLLADLEIAVK